MLQYIILIIKIVTFFIIFNTYAATVDNKSFFGGDLQSKRIFLHKINYLSPFSYSKKIHTKGIIPPDEQQNQNIDVNFQFSMKVLMFNNIFQYNNALYFAYTQNSYWQAYNISPYFRATNYEPEIFIRHYLNIVTVGNWRLLFLDVGYTHQSNGVGGDLERTWNRLYANFKIVNDNFTIGIKTWYIFHGILYKKYNPDLKKYLGYGNISLEYSYNNSKFIFSSTNKLFSMFKYGNYSLIYIYKLRNATYLFFKLNIGYGQNLNEYNHHNTSFAIGIAINNQFFG